MKKFSAGQVVHVDQGNPDDNFYAKVVMSWDDDTTTLEGGMLVQSDQLRSLTWLEATGVNDNDAA